MTTDRKISMLDPLIGTWTVEGRNLSAAPRAADMPVTGTWKVEVMDGGKFLESHWKYDSGGAKHIGLSVLGFQNDDPQLKMFNFDNGGFYRAYNIIIEGNLWKIAGETERASIVFKDTNAAYEEFWEIKTAGTWRPLCRRNGEKRAIYEFGQT